MSSIDIIDQVREFMRGSDWQESIQIFVEANCTHFKGNPSNGFSHEQYQIWKNYQDICESILASALDDSVGCSMKDFENALSDLSKEPANGPREGMKRDILSQLLTYADFNDFCVMMNVAITYQYPDQMDSSQTGYHHREGDPIDLGFDGEERRDDKREENRALLLQLSFSEKAVDYVLSNSVPDSSLDHLIDMLQELGSNTRRPDSGSSDVSITIAPDLRSDDNVSIRFVPDIPKPGKDNCAYGTVDNTNEEFRQENLENECITSFAQECLQDPGELRAKFVVALSILDSVDSGNMSEGVLEKLTWASSMCTLFQEMVCSYSSEVPFEQYCFTYARGLVAWFDELDKAFFTLKIGQENGLGTSEAELRRIIALEDLASMGTEDERLLHGLISRHEEVLKELSGLHGKCIVMTSTTSKGPRIKREHLEELYLYLKEQVNSGSDLAAISDEMYGQVSNLISSESSTEAVNLLLDIHVLEDEQILLKRQIMSLLRDPNAKEEREDELEEISLFAQKRSPGHGEVKGGSDVDAKSTVDAWGLGGSAVDSTPLWKSNSGATLPPLVSPGKEYRGIRQEIKDKEDKESLEAQRLALIREHHRNGLKQLTAHLQDQKARAMKAMERRMALRNKDKSGINDAGRSTRDVLEGGGDCKEKDQIVDLDELNEIEEALVSGYKKRCVLETRLAKGNGGILTKELIHQAKEDSAADLKRRHETELKKLMDELAHSRQKERNRIKDMLYTKRQRNKGDNSATSLADEELLLNEFEEDQDKKEREAISNIQKQACIELVAAITSGSGDGSSIAPIDALTGGNIITILHDSAELSSPPKRKTDGDEDNYFESPSGKKENHSSSDIEEWLLQLRGFSKSYEAVGASILRKIQQTGNTNEFDKQQVPQKVFGMTMNACEAQLLDEGASVLSFAHSNRFKAESMDAIKARILDEFEKSKLKSELATERAREERSDRLRKRRDRRRQGGTYSEEGDIEIVGEPEDDALSEILNNAMNNLVDESTDETLSSVVRIHEQSIPDRQNKKGISSYRTESDRSEKSKMIAAEKEYQKELTDDLYAQMALRKSNLEERLRSRKANGSSALEQTATSKLSSESDSKLEGREAVNEDEANLNKLEMAYGLVTELVHGAHGEELKKMDLDSLLGMIDHAMREKRNTRNSDSKLPVVTPPSTSNIYRDGYQEILEDIDTLLGKKPENLPFVDPSAEIERRQRYKEHMDGLLKHQAKTLSIQESDERAKHDLRMKIEQARQQQNLQRKLLERRQSNANRQVNLNRGAGYSSVAAGNLLAGMMSHSKNGKDSSSKDSPQKASLPSSSSSADLRARGLSTSNLYRK